MGNSISEALKIIKIFLEEYAPRPPRGLRLWRLFHYAFQRVPNRKNHATPLILKKLLSVNAVP